MATIYEQELTDEGKRMWENIINFEMQELKTATAVKTKTKPAKLPKLNMFEVEVIFMRRELRRMIKNSENVIADCDRILAKIETKEEYLKSEAKVAKLIHTNSIERLQRILNSQEAFSFHIPVPDEEERPYKNV